MPGQRVRSAKEGRAAYFQQVPARPCLALRTRWVFDFIVSERSKFEFRTFR